MKLILTGAAGFIGAAVCRSLLQESGIEILGIDNLNSYYDVELKKARLKLLEPMKGFSFIKANIADAESIHQIFKTHRPQKVVNLAAQAGVRYSIEHPEAYVESNLVGFSVILDASRRNNIEHLVYASTSSVYGANLKMPFSTHEGCNHPLSLYAATKKANELMAHSYSSMFQLPTTGLRFFTVYGPWGRPDMALFNFTKRILSGNPIDVFNHGKHQRDFTYIDDIVEGVKRVVLGVVPKPDPEWNAYAPDPATSSAPYRIYNIGNNRTESLMRYIEVLENCLGKKAQINFLPLQKGDVPATSANIDDLVRDYGYRPKTTIDEGIKKFVQWYREYFRE